MKTAAIVVLVLAVAIATVVAFLPASLVDGRIASATQGKVRLADAAGTVWEGRGVLTDAAGTWRMPLGWTISKADVLRGIRAVVLHPVDGAASPAGTVEVVDDGMRLRDLRVEMPAQAFLGALPMRPLPTLGGTVALTARDLAWNNTAKTGAMEAHWSGARVAAGENVADLGTVTFAAAPQGSRIAGKLTNSGGDVTRGRHGGHRGRATSRWTRRCLQTPARPPPSPARSPRSGTPDANGSVRIGWRGRLR